MSIARNNSINDEGEEIDTIIDSFISVVDDKSEIHLELKDIVTLLKMLNESSKLLKSTYEELNQLNNKFNDHIHVKNKIFFHDDDYRESKDIYNSMVYERIEDVEHIIKEITEKYLPKENRY